MATPRTIAFHTLGCKLNYSETSSIGRMFENAGYGIVSFKKPADLYVINTCSVTDFADRKCRQTVRRALKQNAQAKVIVIGCYAQLKPKEIAEIPGVDLVLGAAEKFRILDFVEELYHHEGQGLVFASSVHQANTFEHSVSYGDRTRSFLKVQDGCDYKCAFCTIPLARGKSRSDTIESVIQRARQVAELGVKEVVLTGVNIGDFGNGTEVIEGRRAKKEALFIDLLRALDAVKGINRFRISSIEPNLLTDEIIEAVAASQRFMPHFHIPLQSGNDRLLKLMRRRYKRERYASRVEKIKATMPHACIGADVIVGFPGETDDDFNESYRFVNELDVSYLHVFTYSERPNTAAMDMPDPVPMSVRKKRNEMLRILSEKKRRHFYEQHIGSQRPVLFEKSKQTDILSGFTDNYIQVQAPASAFETNQIKTVVLGHIGDDGLVQVERIPALV